MSETLGGGEVNGQGCRMFRRQEAGPWGLCGPGGAPSQVLSQRVLWSFLALQGLLMLLQNLPTIHWGNEEIGLLLAEAYRLKYMFADAPNHYRR